ncbi:hypothetical protein [Desulfitobacterium sp.]|uniref:hypothetical protein n=1 Tax=Desulfitobacterium sp. TaxID=49981 RepID=UPI002B1FCC23|nr:hypothetical protein [Desulfitobacterium sp.]MEA4902196.1 hypothetical protein [Desulfitobacterium sp.]
MNNIKVAVTLDQLKEWLSSADYSGLYDTMTRLEELGLLKPVGSARNNNGMVPPLRLKYRILRPQEDDSADFDAIRQLSPRP